MKIARQFAKYPIVASASPRNRRELVGLREHARVHGYRQKNAHQRGQQPARPPHPERAEPDTPPVACLREEQRRDEKAREDEERVDSQEAAREVPAVEEQDGGDGKAAQPVERGLVRQAWRFVIRAALDLRVREIPQPPCLPAPRQRLFLVGERRKRRVRKM